MHENTDSAGQPEAPRETMAIVTPSVLRQMLIEHIAAAQRGEISADFLRGYTIALFHAGAVTQDEASELLTGNGAPFELK